MSGSAAGQKRRGSRRSVRGDLPPHTAAAGALRGEGKAAGQRGEAQWKEARKAKEVEDDEEVEECSRDLRSKMEQGNGAYAFATLELLGSLVSPPAGAAGAEENPFTRLALQQALDTRSITDQVVSESSACANREGEEEEEEAAAVTRAGLSSPRAMFFAVPTFTERFHGWNGDVDHTSVFLASVSLFSHAVQLSRVARVVLYSAAELYRIEVAMVGAFPALDDVVDLCLRFAPLSRALEGLPAAPHPWPSLAPAAAPAAGAPAAAPRAGRWMAKAVGREGEGEAGAEPLYPHAVDWEAAIGALHDIAAWFHLHVDRSACCEGRSAAPEKDRAVVALLPVARVARRVAEVLREGGGRGGRGRESASAAKRRARRRRGADGGDGGGDGADAECAAFRWAHFLTVVSFMVSDTCRMLAAAGTVSTTTTSRLLQREEDAERVVERHWRVWWDAVMQLLWTPEGGAPPQGTISCISQFFGIGRCEEDRVVAPTLDGELSAALDAAVRHLRGVHRSVSESSFVRSGCEAPAAPTTPPRLPPQPSPETVNAAVPSRLVRPAPAFAFSVEGFLALALHFAGSPRPGARFPPARPMLRFDTVVWSPAEDGGERGGPFSAPIDCGSVFEWKGISVSAKYSGKVVSRRYPLGAIHLSAHTVEHIRPVRLQRRGAPFETVLRSVVADPAAWGALGGVPAGGAAEPVQGKDNRQGKGDRQD